MFKKIYYNYKYTFAKSLQTCRPFLEFIKVLSNFLSVCL